VFLNALLLKTCNLEEISEPEHVLHQKRVLRFLLSIPTGPKHLTRVYVIKDDSECLGSAPKRKQNPYLLGRINVLNNVSELLTLGQKTLLECEEFDILDDEAYFVFVVIAFLV
jgi:hypothetical protein